MAKKNEQLTIEARAAYEAFARMIPTLSSFASAMAGKPLQVEASSKGTYTDGSKLYIRVPYEFGRMPDHTRALCEARDEFDVSMCPACELREQVTSQIYHEISHNAFGSFDVVHPRKVAGLLTSFGLDEYASRTHRHLSVTHGRNTPKAVAEAMSPYLELILMGIEDVRVDSAMARERPGMLAIRRAMVHRAIAERGEGLLELDLNSQAVLGLLMVASYVDHHGVLDPYVSETLDQGDIAQVIEAAEEGDDVTDSVALSMLFEQRMQGYGFFEPDEPDEGGEGESNDDAAEGDQADADGDSSGQGDAEGGPDGDAQPDEADGDQGGEPGGSGNPSPAEGGSVQPERAAPDGGAAVERDGSPAEEEDGSGGEDQEGLADADPSDERPGGDENDDTPVDDTAGLEPSPRPDPADFGTDGPSRSDRQLIESVLPTEPEPTAAEADAMEATIETADHFDSPSVMLSRVVIHKETRRGGKALVAPEGVLAPALMHMRAVFEENRRSKNDRNRRSGRVSSRVLGRRAWSDDPRLFHRKVIPGKRDYAVLIGIDVSGSTHGRRVELEKEAAFAQAELCHRMGLKFAVYAHSGSYASDYSGGAALDFWEVKSFDAPWDPRAKARMAGLKAEAMNLDGHTMEFYRKTIMRVQATDRIIMYYSDGAMPAENYAEELRILKQQIKQCERDDIVLMAVGVNTDDPVKHGLDTVRLDSINDVSKVVRHLGDRLTAL